MKTRVTFKSDYYSGNRKSWYKLIDSVDTDKTNGYAFDGEFLQNGSQYDLEIGSIVLECRPTGSVKHSGKKGLIYKITPEGPEDITSNPDGYNWKTDFLTLRDELHELINADNNTESLMLEREQLLNRLDEINKLLGE